MLITLSPSLASAANVISIQSVNIAPYDEAYHGLQNSCKCDIKKWILSDMKGYDVVKELRTERPDVIIAIGSGALERIMAIKDIPIIVMMVIDINSSITGHANITGINMDIPPDRQISIISQAFPGVKEIGLLYNPKNRRAFVEKARASVESRGMKLIANEVINSRKVPSRLDMMTGEIGVYWMLPDIDIITPETVEILFLYSIKNRVPVVTFSKKYLEMGAVMSLEVDSYDIGAQAADILGQILAGKEAGNIPLGSAKKINITINQRTAQKLGLEIGSEILNRAKLFNRD
ncbi:MAG: ABC transporter substrate binding protein [Nitrospirota bacterium]